MLGFADTRRLSSIPVLVLTQQSPAAWERAGLFFVLIFIIAGLAKLSAKVIAAVSAQRSASRTRMSSRRERGPRWRSPCRAAERPDSVPRGLRGTESGSGSLRLRLRSGLRQRGGASRPAFCAELTSSALSPGPLTLRGCLVSPTQGWSGERPTFGNRYTGCGCEDPQDFVVS